MKSLLFLFLLLLGSFALQDAQDMHEPAVPGDHHKWLQQLVGDWTVTSEAHIGPGAEPMKMDFTDSVRSIGGLWILSEGKAEFGGMPFTSVMTLGYDLTEKAFVGTWIDSMQTHLWTYRGTLDDSKKVLTLETTGPSFTDPTVMVPYRDVIEIKSPDHRTLTSSMLGDEGTWTAFMKADYRRKK
jgi:hypothetical protein